MYSLPIELREHVFGFLALRDLLVLRLTSRALSDLANHVIKTTVATLLGTYHLHRRQLCLLSWTGVRPVSTVLEQQHLTTSSALLPRPCHAKTVSGMAFDVQTLMGIGPGYSSHRADTGEEWQPQLLLNAAAITDGLMELSIDGMALSRRSIISPAPESGSEDSDSDGDSDSKVVLLRCTLSKLSHSAVDLHVECKRVNGLHFGRILSVHMEWWSLVKLALCSQ
ncbi:hypothetical protein RI367_001121 [Sorochytrium milnesiophthora]